MSRLFGALANAYGQYEGGRFKRKQYDDSQAQQTLENQRRAFEFAATNGRLEEQMRLMQQQREDALQRQREMDVVGAQQKGYETAAPEAAASAANAFMQSQGMGMPSGVVKAKGAPVAQYEAEGMKFGDPSLKPREVQYASVGGRLMRYDPQREVNEQTSQAFQKYMASLSEKKMLQDQRAQDREDQIRLTAAMRPAAQTQPKRDLFTDGKGNYQYVRQGENVPPGWMPANRSMQPASASTKAPTAGERQAQALLEFGTQGAQGAAAKYRSGFSPNMMDQIAEQLPPAVGNVLMSGDAQELYADTEKLVMASQYLLSGKAVTKVEAKKIARGLVIQPGDTEETKAYKRAQIQQRLDILAKAAGQPSPTIDTGAANSGAGAPWERKKP